MSTNRVGQVNGASTFSIAPPILIAAEKNSTIRAALEAADKNGNSNGLIDNSGELQAAVENLQKTISDTEFEEFVSRVVSRIKTEETAPAAENLPEVVIEPQTDKSYLLIQKDGTIIANESVPFKTYDVIKGIKWTCEKNTVTAKGIGSIKKRGLQDLTDCNGYFYSKPLNITGAKKIVVTVIKMEGNFPLDGSGSGLAVLLPYVEKPGKFILELPDPAGRNYNRKTWRILGLKEGDKLVFDITKSTLKFMPCAFLNMGESITLKVDLQ